MMNDINHILLKNKLKLDCTKLRQPRRAQVYVGFQCHQGCGFCYYKSRCSEKMFSFDDVKKQIEFEFAYGIRDFELTGGEPSESKDLRKICEYIKSKNASSKIAVITNGGLYACDVWDVIDEVLVSYHLGKNDIYYDKVMFPKGCTYSKVKATIDKARSYGKVVRINTVVAKFNYDKLQHILDDLVQFKPSIVNFLPVNLFDEVDDKIQNQIDYTELRPVIKHAIDFIEANVEDTLVFVRYMPFCQMEGYEHYVIGHLQHIYDWFDWNTEMSGIDVIAMSKDPVKHLAKLKTYGSTSIDAALKAREAACEKANECNKCRYNLICDGVEKTNGHHLLQCIEPSYGKQVVDFMAYAKNSTELKYNKTYG